MRAYARGAFVCLSLLTFAFCLLSTAARAAAWEKQKTGTFAWLHAVHFVDERRGWAAGGKGALLSTADGGATWRPQTSGVGEDLYDVKFFDEREGWAVGSGGALLHTADGGRTWADEKRVTTHALERLFFVGRRAWAVGFGGSVVALKG